MPSRTQRLMTQIERAEVVMERQWRAFMRFPGVTLGASIGSASFAATFEPSSLVLAIPAGYYIGSALTLRSLQPRDYARVVIHGRSDVEIITAVSQHIEDFLKEVNKAQERGMPLWTKLEEIATSGESWEAKARAFASAMRDGDPKGAIDAVDSFLTRKSRMLNRIEQMKLLAAEELRIDPRRLCRNIFEYSPNLHRDTLVRWVLNYRTLLAWRDRLQTHEVVKRFSSIVLKNVRLARDYERARSKQVRLRASARYISDIVALAQVSSAANSLQKYAQLLQRVSFDHRDFIKNKKKFSGNPNDSAYVECEKQFRFIRRKVCAYAGADLTLLLVQIVKAEIRKRGSNRDARIELEPLLVTLERLQKRRLPKEQRVLLPNNGSEIANKEAANRSLGLISRLPGFVETALAESRTATLDSFSAACELGLLPRRGRTIVATHGYSCMVRDLLKHGLHRVMSARHAAVSDTRSKPLPPSAAELYNMPDVFLLDYCQTDRSDVALIEYELKEDDRREQGFVHLTIGAPKVLANMVGPGDQVVFLIGAELFDDAGHVLQRSSTQQVVDELADTVRQRGGTAMKVVATHSFKRLERPLHRSEVVDDRLERVSVFSGESVDLILAGASVLALDDGAAAPMFAKSVANKQLVEWQRRRKLYYAGSSSNEMSERVAQVGPGEPEATIEAEHEGG